MTRTTTLLAGAAAVLVMAALFLVVLSRSGPARGAGRWQRDLSGTCV